MANGTIAVIEDDSALAELLADLLADAGYVPRLIDGEELSLADVVAVDPDLVILDLILGGVPNGWEHLRQMRRHPRLASVPVLICSADLESLQQKQAQLRADPMVATLSKPFDLVALEAAVAGLIEGQRAPTWNDDRDLVIVADGTARLVDASAALLRLLRVPPVELRSLRVPDIVAHSRQWTETEWARYMAEGRWEGPVILRTRDGASVPAHSTAEIVHALGQTWHISRLDLTTS